MDEQFFTYDDPEKIKRYNKHQMTHTDISNTVKDTTLNSTCMKPQNLLRASDVCVNEPEFEISTLDAGRVENVADKGHNSDSIMKGDTMTSKLVLNTSNIDNMQIPYSANMVSRSSLASEFNVVSEVSKGKQAPICEKNSTEKSHADCAEQRLSPAGLVTKSEQVTETHNEVSFFAEDQGDERIYENQDMQKTAACTVGSVQDGVTLKINNGGLNHSMSSLPQRISEVTLPYTPASTLVTIGNEEENIYSESSDCYIQQAKIIKSTTQKSSNFEPVILNVCGGYHEMETDMNENQNLTSLEATVKNQQSGDTTMKNMNTENIQSAEPVSRLASELLQGMIQCAASAFHNSKEPSSKDIVLKIDKCKTYSGTNISTIKHPLVQKKTPIETDKGSKTERKHNSLEENVRLSTDTVLSTKSSMLSRAAEKSLADSSGLHIPVKVPQSASLKAASVMTSRSQSAPDRSAQLLSDVLVNPTQTTGLPTTYSCVFVEDCNNGNQGKVAVLVPQSSLSDLNYLTNITSSILSKMSVTESQTTVKGALPCSVASFTEISNNNSLSFKNRISKLVANTVNNFYLQGKDLKDTNLLKIVAIRKKESLPYAVKCSICGEGYYDKEGLDFHLKRTVFHLLFNCSYCKQKVTFYNKCSLWMHLKNEDSKCMLNYNEILWLKPYEFDADNSCEDQMSEAVDKASTETLEAVHPNPGISRDDNVPASPPASIEQVVQTQTVRDTTASLPPLPSRKRKHLGKISQCPICVQYFPDISVHLCPATARTFPCSYCGMFLPSICAREAHIKIHQGVAKNICCPECGAKDFKTVNRDGDMKSVFDHVDACKHFNRIISIQCFCKQELDNADSLAEHFTENHFRTIFKCPLCILAFTQHDNFVEHVDKIHKSKETNIGATVLCLLCQNVLKSSVELKAHLDHHVEQLQIDATFKWKCFICAKSFTDKAELNKHTDVDHMHKYKRCTICYSLFWSRQNLVEHIVEKKCLRSLAKKLHYCVDMQPGEFNQSSKSVCLSKLFEINQNNPGVGKTQKQLNCAPVVSKNPLFVKIAPKVVSMSAQSVASLQSQPNSQQIIQITQPVTKQKQTCAEVSSTVNKMPNQPCKIIITSKTNSTLIRKSISVNQCIVCKQIIESVKLTEHLKFHQSQGVIICFHCLKRDFATVEEARKHSELCGQNMLKQAEDPPESARSDNSKSKDKTPEANSGSGQSNGESTEQQQMETNNKNAEKHGESTEQQQMETNDKNAEKQTQSVFPCLLCGLAFQSLSAREEHVSRSHDGIRIVYHCGLCRKKGKYFPTIFTRKEQVTRHIIKKHRIGNMDSVNRLIRAEEQNASSGQKLQSSTSAEGVSAPKRLRLAGEGDYMCGKCGFSCSKSEEFSQHIASHNSSKEPQCPECGLCFTVFPALKKHLLAVHKIHAVDDYLKAHNVTELDLDEEFDVLPEIHPYNKPQTKLLDSGKDKPSTSIKLHASNPLECTVCYKVFDVEADLKTHMRNHGMAFIRSKRHRV